MFINRHIALVLVIVSNTLYILIHLILTTIPWVSNGTILILQRKHKKLSELPKVNSRHTQKLNRAMCLQGPRSYRMLPIKNLHFHKRATRSEKNKWFGIITRGQVEANEANENNFTLKNQDFPLNDWLVVLIGVTFIISKLASWSVPCNMTRLGTGSSGRR